jgi:hypothetical protein
MFDRSNRSEGPVSVEITFTNGRQLSGAFVLPPGRTLPEALNGPSTFIEFEPIGEQRTFVAKGALQCVTPLKSSPAATDPRTTNASSTAE